jgi:hypothetical protein
MDNIKSVYQNIKGELFNDYIVTYGYHDREHNRSIMLYNYDNIFTIFYLFILSLFNITVLNKKCLRTSEYIEDAKNSDIIPFGIYYDNGIKHGFIRSIDGSNKPYKNKVLYAIINGKHNLSSYFELFYHSLKKNINYTYAEIISIFMRLLSIESEIYENIVIFFIDKYEENTFKKEDKLIIYD